MDDLLDDAGHEVVVEAHRGAAGDDGAPIGSLGRQADLERGQRRRGLRRDGLGSGRRHRRATLADAWSAASDGARR